MNDTVRQVLSVEDNAADAELLREFLIGPLPGIRLRVLSSGGDALDYLARRAPFENEPRPQLVLLDLNLPGCDGREVLREMRRSDELCSIPVIVLSTSNNPEDVRLAYELGASCFFCKPVDLDSMERIFTLIRETWLCYAELPEPRPLPLGDVG